MKSGDWIEYETVQRPGKKVRAYITGIWPDCKSVRLDLSNIRNWSINLGNIGWLRVLRKDQLILAERESCR